MAKRTAESSTEPPNDAIVPVKADSLKNRIAKQKKEYRETQAKQEQEHERKRVTKRTERADTDKIRREAARVIQVEAAKKRSKEIRAALKARLDRVNLPLCSKCGGKILQCACK